MKRKILFTMIMGLLVSFQAQAKIWYVDASAVGSQNGVNWADAFNNLQIALDAASGGDSIFIAKGIYKPTKPADGVSTNNRDKAFVLSKNLKIFGSFAGNEANLSSRASDSMSLFVTNATILSGNIGNPNDSTDNAYHVIITTNSGNGFVLNGFTISDGNANASTLLTVLGRSITRNAGAGVYNDKSTGSFSNVVISNNNLRSLQNYTGGGAGMYNYKGEITISHFTFANNVAINTNGGAINNINSSPQISNGRFFQNKATGDDQGGGAINNQDSSNAVVTDVIFESNTTAGSGGGVYNDNSLPEFTRVSFINNSASGSGGGVDADGGSNATFNDVTFQGNSSDDDGGAFYAWKSSVTMDNVRFLGNHTDGNGGAMYHYNDCHPAISNAIISHNSAGNSYGGLGIEWNSEAVVTNALISKNTAIGNGGGIGTYGDSATFILTNVTIVNNSAANGGGGYDLGTSTKMRNSILLGNYPNDVDANLALFLNVHHILFADNSDPIFVEDGSVNRTGDTLSWPVFVDTLNENYMVDPTGPALDKGDNSFFNANLTPDLSMFTKDLRGAARIMGSSVDLGAYEYCSQPLIPSLSVSSDLGTTIQTGTTVIFTASSITNGGDDARLRWLKNSNAIAGATSTTYTAVAGTDFVNGDVIAARLYSSEPCADPDSVVSNELVMTIPTGIDQVDAANARFKIYPNPNDGNFQILGEFVQNDSYQVIVTDLMGRTIFSQQVTANGNQINVQIGNNLSSGVYLLSLMNAKQGKQIVKFVKK